MKMEFGFLPILLFLASLVGVYIFVFGFLRKFNELYHVGRLKGETKYHLPPGDMGWPLLGNLTSFLKALKSPEPESFINDLVSRYGRTGIYKTYLFGRPGIIVCTPETCRKVLMDEEKFKNGRPKATFALTGRKAFHSISNEEHKWIRRLSKAPINGDKALTLYVEYIEKIFVKSLEDFASMKEPIELLTEIRKVAFKVITNILMGNHSDFTLATMEKLYTELIAGLHYSVPINIPGFIFHKALKARNKLVKMVQSLLDEKRASKSNQNSNKYMIDLLLEVEDEDGRKLDDEEIIDLLLGYMLAGYDNVAHAIMWAVIYLRENQDILKKAKEEQEEIMMRRPATQKGLNLKEIKQMEYLAKVIDETLRKCSISLSLFREATVDVKMNGYIIPKGWKVLVWNRAVNTDAENHLKPKEFNPERWDNEKPKAGSFIVFGLGSRFCPGSDLAKIEISIFLHHFLLHYKIQRLNPESPVKYSPMPLPSDKCLARVIRVQ